MIHGHPSINALTAAERRHDLLAEAERNRLYDQVRVARSAASSIRALIGTRLVRAGEALSGQPTGEPVYRVA